ncbi:MAG: chemotaxis protein CheX [Planctomycetota bacterium]
MDSQFILPFVESVTNVFETMLQLEVQVGTPSIKPSDADAHDVSGIIGLSGDVEGTIVLGFPTATAERAVAVFTGMELDSTHEDFPDAIGELVNMVSGGAKAKFTGRKASITCPSVIVGKHHTVSGRKDITTIHIPVECDLGEFSVDVSIRDAVEAEAAA